MLTSVCEVLLAIGALVVVDVNNDLPLQSRAEEAKLVRVLLPQGARSGRSGRLQRGEVRSRQLLQGADLRLPLDGIGDELGAGGRDRQVQGGPLLPGLRQQQVQSPRKEAGGGRQGIVGTQDRARGHGGWGGSADVDERGGE